MREGISGRGLGESDADAPGKAQDISCACNISALQVNAFLKVRGIPYDGLVRSVSSATKHLAPQCFSNSASTSF